jgi:hypothetical protein
MLKTITVAVILAIIAPAMAQDLPPSVVGPAGSAGLPPEAPPPTYEQCVTRLDVIQHTRHRGRADMSMAFYQRDCGDIVNNHVTPESGQ